MRGIIYATSFALHPYVMGRLPRDPATSALLNGAFDSNQPELRVAIGKPFKSYTNALSDAANDGRF